MSREPETKWYSHLSLFVCFCLLFLHTGVAKAFTCFGFLFCWSFFFFEKRSNNFFSFRALLYLELCYRIQCNWKYVNLFLIGCWTTTSWRIYHQAFSVTITGWRGCKFGVFSNICVRATHGIRPSKQPFECVGDIAYLGYILIKLH